MYIHYVLLVVLIVSTSGAGKLPSPPPPPPRPINRNDERERRPIRPQPLHPPPKYNFKRVGSALPPPQPQPKKSLLFWKNKNDKSSPPPSQARQQQQQQYDIYNDYRDENCDENRDENLNPRRAPPPLDYDYDYDARRDDSRRQRPQLRQRSTSTSTSTPQSTSQSTPSSGYSEEIHGPRNQIVTQYLASSIFHRLLLTSSSLMLGSLLGLFLHKSLLSDSNNNSHTTALGLGIFTALLSFPKGHFGDLTRALSLAVIFSLQVSERSERALTKKKSAKRLTHS